MLRSKDDEESDNEEDPGTETVEDKTKPNLDEEMKKQGRWQSNLKYDRIREESYYCQSTILDSMMRNEENHQGTIKKEVSKIIPKGREVCKPINSKLELKKILIDKMEANNSINRSDIQRQLYKALVEAYEADKILLDTYGDTLSQLKDLEWSSLMIKNPTTLEQTGGPKEEVREAKQSTDDFEGPATRSFETGNNPVLSSMNLSNLASNLAQQDPRESFDELRPTLHFNFIPFVLEPAKCFSNSTPELLAATPLPCVPNSRSSCYTSSSLSSITRPGVNLLVGGQAEKYSTSVQDYAADYGHIKWIEDLVPNSMWSQTIVKYDKFALWGISHWGKKRRQFYAFATLRESARDVYSKRRIIAVTKFKEGDFHRLRIQDIEDMLLLLVQGKVTNLSVEERIAFNVSLRMFTRRVVIQRRVEDLQLGVESYQKKLNLTKPDTYRSNLRRQDAYTPYSDPRGFIYENKDKKNRLMRIDELHKFSDGTLDDVRTALNDRLKGIRMEYLPQTFWSQRDKANVGALTRG
ncbi:hypothetical protein Tco_0260859 [Tanacetum coccineum]